MTNEEFMQSIPELEGIYVIISRVTRLPYVECDAEDFDDKIFIFTEEDAGKEKAKELNDDDRPVINASIAKDDMLRLFSECYIYGVNALEFNSKGETYKIQLKNLIRRVEMKGLPEDKKPLENPELQLSITYYLQEARRKPSKRDVYKLQEMDEEMAVNFMRSKYLVAYKGEEAAEEDGRRRIQFMAIKATETEAFIPIFTDASEYHKFKKDQDVSAIIASYDELIAMEYPDEIKGFLLNPVTTAMPLPKEYFSKLKDTISL